MRYMREALEKPALRDAVADLLHSTVFFLSQAFARFVATVMAGLAVQAVNGASRDEMKRTADLALNAIRLA